MASQGVRYLQKSKYRLLLQQKQPTEEDYTKQQRGKRDESIINIFIILYYIYTSIYASMFLPSELF